MFVALLAPIFFVLVCFLFMQSVQISKSIKLREPNIPSDTRHSTLDLAMCDPNAYAIKKKTEFS